MHIISASDKGYLRGLWVAWASALYANKGKRFIHFYLLHDGIIKSDLDKFEARMNLVSDNFKIHPVLLDTSTFRDLPDLFNSKMTYARLMIPSLVDVDKAIYVDCDFLFLRDLEELWEYELGENLIGACEDFDLHSDDLSFFENDYPHLKTHKYFNAGLLLLNLKLIRDNATFDKALNVLLSNHRHCLIKDQSALNVLCAGNVSYFDPNINYQLNVDVPFSVEQLSLIENRTINFHYVTRDKPWGACCKGIPQRLYALFEAGLGRKRKGVSRCYSRIPVILGCLWHLLKVIRLQFVGGILLRRRAFYWKLAGDHWRLFRLMGKEAWGNRLIADVFKEFNFQNEQRG